MAFKDVGDTEPLGTQLRNKNRPSRQASKSHPGIPFVRLCCMLMSGRKGSTNCQAVGRLTEGMSAANE